MGFDVSIIGKNGEEIPESNDLYFNYLRNPLGFHQFVLHNTGVDIRKWPFFQYKEDYKNIHPHKERKVIMKRKAIEILARLSSMDKLTVKFENFSWDFFEDSHAYLMYREYYGRGLVIARLPRNAEIDPDDLDASYMTHEKYIEWAKEFLKLIKLLCRKNNGFYVSS